MWWHIAILIATIAGPIVTKVLKLLGFGMVAYVGINVVMTQAEAYITSQLGSTAADLRGLLGLAKVDVAVNILLAAITTRMALAGVNKLSGRKKEFVFKA